jgi:hypothetical protein
VQAVKKGKKAAAAAAGEAGPEVTMWARVLTGEGALVKRWRLILRNLPFKVGLALAWPGLAWLLGSSAWPWPGFRGH